MTWTVWIAKLMTRYRPSARRRTSATSVRIPLPFDTCDDCLVDSTACSPYRSGPLRARRGSCRPPRPIRCSTWNILVADCPARSAAADEALHQVVELGGAAVVELDASPAAGAGDPGGLPEALQQLLRHLGDTVAGRLAHALPV